MSETLNSPAHDLALWLETQAVGKWASTEPWAINVGAEPDSPVDCITIYDTGGDGPDTDQQDIEQQNIQVRVRSASYTDAWSKQRQIQMLLVRSDIQTAEWSYVEVDVLVDITGIGRDDRNNFLLVCNYRVIREER